MNLVDLKPRKAELKLSTIKETLVLNPMTLADEAWLEGEYGAEQVQKIFSDVNIKEIARIVYRLLNVESKKIFAKQKVQFVSEDGDITEMEMGGVELLKQACVGWDDKLALVNCLIDNLGLSRPDVDENDKKKGKKEKE